MDYFKIIGKGKYLPEKKVFASDLDKHFNLAEGSIFSKHGVKSRSHVTKEQTLSFIAAESLKEALKNAKLNFEELDLLIFASVSYEHPVPNTSASIQRELGEEESGVPCLDINSSCISFLSALEVAGSFISTGKYKKIAVCSAEVPSRSLNPKNEETFSLFGDGSASFILTADPEKKSGLSYSKFFTNSKGYESTILKGGGDRYHPREYKDDETFTFSMKGKQSLLFSIKLFKSFVRNNLAETEKSFDDFNYIIPHQASNAALAYFAKTYEIKDKMFNRLDTYGNCVSASIPMALYDCLGEGIVKSGDEIMLCGTAAGISLGMLFLKI